MKDYDEMRAAIKKAMAKIQSEAPVYKIGWAKIAAIEAATRAGYEVAWKDGKNPLPKILKDGKDVTLKVLSEDAQGRTMFNLACDEEVTEDLRRREIGQFKDLVTGRFNRAMNALLEVFPEHPKELLAVVALEHVAKEIDIWSTDHKKKFRSVLR